MSNDNIKNLAASIHGRLQNQARDMNKPFNEVLQYYGIERFLYRLSKTEHGNKFVLKGGLVFYGWKLPLRRPTRDIDLRGYTKNSTENLLGIAKTVCQCPVPDDGLVFHTDSIVAKEIIPEANYRGVRVTLLATLNRSQIPIQVDIGFTDVIVPGAQEIEYPTLLRGMDCPILKSYSGESIISEKFHAMVYLNEINSRMKDFYDVWMLSEKFDFEGTILQKAIEATFQRRETEIPTELPAALSGNFALSNQVTWQVFLLKQKLNRPEIENFSCVIEKLRDFLIPPLQSLSNGESFVMHWEAGKNWS